jgi:hypothetical protein
MATHTFNYALFQQQCPEFATSPVETTLQIYFNMALQFANQGNDNFCGGFNGDALDLVLNYLTAHIAKQQAMIADGQDTVIVTASAIDKVSVSLLAPPVKNMMQYWLATTPYGKQVLALARAQFASGFYVSVGLPERTGFRKVGGLFR